MSADEMLDSRYEALARRTPTSELVIEIAMVAVVGEPWSGTKEALRIDAFRAELDRRIPTPEEADR